MVCSSADPNTNMSTEETLDNSSSEVFANEDASLHSFGLWTEKKKMYVVVHATPGLKCFLTNNRIYPMFANSAHFPKYRLYLFWKMLPVLSPFLYNIPVNAGNENAVFTRRFLTDYWLMVAINYSLKTKWNERQFELKKKKKSDVQMISS